MKLSQFKEESPEISVQTPTVEEEEEEETEENILINNDDDTAAVADSVPEFYPEEVQINQMEKSGPFDEDSEGGDDQKDVIKEESISSNEYQREGVDYLCELCHFKTPFRYALTKHIKYHHEPATHHCSQCPFSSLTASNLKNHIRNNHERTKYFCEQCNGRFWSLINLEAHMKKRHGEDREKFICEECSKLYKDKFVLADHVRRVHLGVKYPCDRCDKQFVQRHSLRMRAYLINSLCQSARALFY